MKLGINGMGRIGKLTLWNHIARKHFSEIVVNVGREVGADFGDLIQNLEKDSSYGRLSNFLHGFNGTDVIDNIDPEAGTLTIDGIPVRFLRTARNPQEIGWKEAGVRIVADCTGAFLDPTTPADASGGSMRGHLEAGAEKVLVSAPFKIKNKGLATPNDSITTVMGINDEMYDPSQHSLISAASCTTTCLSYMMKPILEHYGADQILSASMVTVHAATGSQKVLDSVPKAGAKDLRKSRSILNNIILTTTGAAKALRLVLPEMGEIGFMAESVRVPTSAGSLIILTLNLQSDNRDNPINRSEVNKIYQEAADGPYQDYLMYTEAQNVSSDIIGFPKAAAVIEARETHTRTAYTRVNLDKIPGLPEDVIKVLHSHTLEVPVTQTVIYGWYDNELASYTNMLSELTIHVADQLL
ncbi:MAG: glyceraldehyde-3-phosphate dehydrogenase [Magnetococcales bacterium]|nr:glyceraldehyde-3-phosphate dehydrogenase [Magnetococcales bacterium]